jgi:DNA-binding NarL/FixJ family response regulator
MPEAFGDDITTWLLSTGLSAPVYLLSNLPVDRLAQRAEECGARGYISKGLGIDGVIERVRTILDIPSNHRSNAPTLLINEFLSMAHGRLRRAEAAIAKGELEPVTLELHTLSGEAALLGLTDIARAAEACRGVAAALAGESALVISTSLSAPIASVVDRLADAASKAKVIAPRPTGRSARLLLLDDSDFYRSTLMGLLEDSGYEVVEVRRLSEARYRMHDGHYDLAILDLQLEEGCGSDLIPELREHAPTTRLLLLSGQDEMDHAADLMLSKSLAPGEILDQIDELLRRAPPRAESAQG